MVLPVNYNDCSQIMRKTVREEYVRIQNGLCCYCNAPLDKCPSEDVLRLKIDHKLFPLNFFKYPIHLHHNHNTGLTIGAVHNKCNAVLWQYLNE